MTEVNTQTNKKSCKQTKSLILNTADQTDGWQQNNQYSGQNKWSQSERMAALTNYDKRSKEVVKIRKNDHGHKVWQQSYKVTTVTKNAAVRKDWPRESEIDRGHQKWMRTTKLTSDNEIGRGHQNWPRSPKLTAVTKTDHDHQKWRLSIIIELASWVGD